MDWLRFRRMWSQIFPAPLDGAGKSIVDDSWLRWEN